MACDLAATLVRLTLASVAVSLMLVALLAVTVPAWRAMRVDPVTALRAQ
jgi:ABC-type lipoprotein release transport system permease subunit